MLTELHVEGYRSFEKYAVKDLRRVNLFVGANGCGKTSLLEAVRLVETEHPVEALEHHARMRGEMRSIGVGEGRDALQPDLASCYFQLNLEQTLRIGSHGDHANSLSLAISARAKPDTLESAVTDALYGTTSVLALTQSFRGVNGEHKVPVSHGGVLVGLEAMRFRLVAESVRPVLLPATGLQDAILFYLQDEVDRSIDDALVLRAMRTVSADVIDYRPDSQKGRTTGAYDVRVGLQRLPSRVPIGTLGEGTKRLFGLALALAGSKDSILLIDEVDTGLHYSLMPKLWTFLVKSAIDLNVQLFVTTHSWDRIRGLRQASEADPSLLTQVAVHTIDRRTTTAISSTGDTLGLELTSNFEVRG